MESRREALQRLAWEVHSYPTEVRTVMETKTDFFQLVSAVVGLSVGVGVMTATLLLGAAALLQ